MSPPQPHLLALPYELRLQIYESLLLYPQPKTKTKTSTRSRTTTTTTTTKPNNNDDDDDDLVSPTILLACRQTHHEALPVLYTRNTWHAHPSSLLTSFPRLRPSYPPLREPSVLPLIRRWHLRLRLDCDAPWTARQLRDAFTGCDELVLEVWQAVFLGCGRAVLALFEGVRAVRSARVVGSVAGFEGYARWLEGVMGSPVDADVGAFDESMETSRLVPMYAGVGV